MTKMSSLHLIEEKSQSILKKKYISDEIYTKLDRNDTDMIDSI